MLRTENHTGKSMTTDVSPSSSIGLMKGSVEHQRNESVSFADSYLHWRAKGERRHCPFLCKSLNFTHAFLCTSFLPFFFVDGPSLLRGGCFSSCISMSCSSLPASTNSCSSSTVCSDPCGEARFLFLFRMMTGSNRGCLGCRLNLQYQ